LKEGFRRAVGKVDATMGNLELLFHEGRRKKDEGGRSTSRIVDCVPRMTIVSGFVNASIVRTVQHSYLQTPQKGRTLSFDVWPKLVYSKA
jgi:hypothetical protein